MTKRLPGLLPSCLRAALAAGVVLASAGVPPLAAQHAGHGARADAAPAEAAGGFGEVVFPTSAAPAARAEFERGVLFLHNFHYPQAVRAFARAREHDPRDVMSAAFEALAHTHPVWNEQDTAAARAALRRLAPTRAARLAMARTPRERAWLEAVEALYDGDTPKAVRDTAFSRALARLHAADPRDPEAAAFYALSLLGLNQGDREPRAYALAEAVADSVRRAHPRHPGALHYLIHAVDDPANASRGLEAAHAYARIATGAAHALHMTSHIFIALGMWDDVVRANLQAHEAARGAGRAYGHGTHWLSYGLVQQGRMREARKWVDSTLAYQRDVAAGTTPAVRGRADAAAHAVLLPATYVIDTESWDTPLARLRPDTTHVRDLAIRTAADFFVAYSAARRAGRPVDVTPGSRAADRALADSLLARMAARRALARAGGTRASALGEAEVMEQVLRAELALGAGRRDSAVAILRAAAERLEALPFAFGPPQTLKPPRERLAEILLLQGRPAEALAELDRADRLAPGRTQAMLRRARALDALGRRAEATRVFAALDSIWRGAEADFPWRAEARWGSGALPPGAARVRMDTVEYASGALRLRGSLTRPVGAAGRLPALVVLHGSGGCWDAADVEMLGQIFAGRGYASFFPCRRGLGLSRGQGEAILDQLRREGLTERDSAYAARSTELLTTREMDDVLAALSAVRARPDVDPARVAVTGLSYGGILTLLAAERDPTLRAAVAFAPAAMNWGWNAPLRARLREAARRSRVPTLIVQAENDWNVGPARELPEEMRAAGRDGTGRVYPALGGSANTGHGFMVYAPELWEDEVMEFLGRHLPRGAR